MHKSSVRFGKKESEVRFGSGSAKNSWFGRFLCSINLARALIKNSARFTLSLQLFVRVVSMWCTSLTPPLYCAVGGIML